MPRVAVNGVDIHYELHGGAGAPALLLVSGFGRQLVHWVPGLLSTLAGRGYRVVVHDNRDVGLSTHLHDAGKPDLRAVARGEASPPYTIDDMADDSAALLEALGIEAAHVAGVSMGGMIAQAVAARHPARTLTLTSIMSSTGNPDLPRAAPEVVKMLLRPPARNRQEYIDGAVASGRMYAGDLPFDEASSRARAALAFDRAFDPPGVARQYAAIAARGDRRAALRGLRVPAMVIHGDRDPLILPEAGRDTAAAIPEAELRIIEGMGHSLPVEVHASIADAIDAVAARA